MINSKERKEMIFDAFMLPYGYLFERGNNDSRKQNFLYIFIICLVVNQPFLSEMKVVEHKIN